MINSNEDKVTVMFNVCDALLDTAIECREDNMDVDSVLRYIEFSNEVTNLVGANNLSIKDIEKIVEVCKKFLVVDNDEECVEVYSMNDLKNDLVEYAEEYEK